MSTPKNPDTPSDHGAAPFTLDARFAEDIPEMAADWQGEEQPDPTLVILNEDLAHLLGMDPDWLRTDAGVDFLLGLNPTPTTKMVAQGYAGHQFGQFVPSLGDGRALLLGEAHSTDGVLRDIHLKGSGRTPYSRGADGRSAVGPVLREYIISEAMTALGVPTTRSLAVITTGRKVQRDMVMPGAVLVRVASSHIRVGSFQYANISGGVDLSRRLADHVIMRHFPHLSGAAEKADGSGGSGENIIPSPQLYSSLFEAIMQAQVDTAAKWMRLGFVHGVLNTDNTLVSGETIDYGPCAFMERYRDDAVFSSIDRQGRYMFANQPVILGWNLARLVETLIPLLGATPDAGMEQAQTIMDTYNDRYQQAFHREMAASLGVDPSRDGVDELIADYLDLLRTHSPDLTTVNRTLSDWNSDSVAPGGFEDWIQRWLAYGPDFTAMQQINPVYTPRNHLVEEALEQAVAGEWDAFHDLLARVLNPFDRQAGAEHFEQPSPDGFEENYMTFCGT